MKRITRIAKRWAGEIRPYGNVRAASPETVPPGGAGAEALELTLGERAEDDDAVGVARGDRRRRVAHRRRAAAPAAAPLHVGEAQLGQAEGGGQARRDRCGRCCRTRSRRPAADRCPRPRRRAGWPGGPARTRTPAPGRACSRSSRRRRRPRPALGGSAPGSSLLPLRRRHSHYRIPFRIRHEAPAVEPARLVTPDLRVLSAASRTTRAGTARGPGPTARPADAGAARHPGSSGTQEPAARHREGGVEPADLERDAEPLARGPRGDREERLGRGLHRHVPARPHVEDAAGNEHVAGREREGDHPSGPRHHAAPGAPALLRGQLDRVRLEPGQLARIGRGGRPAIRIGSPAPIPGAPASSDASSPRL